MLNNIKEFESIIENYKTNNKTCDVKILVEALSKIVDKNSDNYQEFKKLASDYISSVFERINTATCNHSVEALSVIIHAIDEIDLVEKKKTVQELLAIKKKNKHNDAIVSRILNC